MFRGRTVSRKWSWQVPAVRFHQYSHNQSCTIHGATICNQPCDLFRFYRRCRVLNINIKCFVFATTHDLLYLVARCTWDSSTLYLFTCPVKCVVKWLYRWSLEMDKQFHPTLHNGCNYLSTLGLKLNHVSKRGFCLWSSDPVHRISQLSSIAAAWKVIGFTDQYCDILWAGQLQVTSGWLWSARNNDDRFPTISP